MEKPEVDGLKHMNSMAREKLRGQVRELGDMIQTGLITPEMVERIEGLSKILPGLIQRQGFDMCDQGDGAQALQWDVKIAGVTYTTCGHNPPHVELK